MAERTDYPRNLAQIAVKGALAQLVQAENLLRDYQKEYDLLTRELGDDIGIEAAPARNAVTQAIGRLEYALGEIARLE